ncbi:Concanavalin A-like lectin/glucanases superfamily protein [Alteromonadaceae bacterium Bs31]|nr:Concanavalin A-like lectin/glucanases superfamily protein [Alteromonadaceae bacterium Bs31]
MTSVKGSSIAILFVLLTVSCASELVPEAPPSELWHLSDFLDEGFNNQDLSIITEGEPSVVSSPFGKSVVFDGDGDRFLVSASPLHGAEQFTVEMLFKPNNAFPDNHDPRIVHIESPDNGKRRFVLEARINKAGEWYFDAFIMSEQQRLPLIDEKLVHTTGEWHHVAVTYGAGMFTTFVDGKKELSEKFNYHPLPKNTQISIGSRMNKIHWFNGEIASLAYTHAVLDADQMPLLALLRNHQAQLSSSASEANGSH